MYVVYKNEKDVIVEEHHLCSICCKMFCCNNNSFVRLRQNAFSPQVFEQYAHQRCVNNPPPQPLL